MVRAAFAASFRDTLRCNGIRPPEGSAAGSADVDGEGGAR